MPFSPRSTSLSTYRRLLKHAFTLCFILLAFISRSQQRTIDSLNSVLKASQYDTAIAKAYVGLTEIFCASNPDTVIPMCNEAIDIIDRNLSKANKEEKHTYLMVKAAAFNNIGYVHMMQGQTEKSLEFFKRCMKIQEDIQDQKGLSNTLNNIGAIYHRKGETGEALEYFLKGLKIQEKIGAKEGIAYSLNNIGAIFEGQGQTEKALDYYHRGLKLQEELGNKLGMGTSLNNLAAMYIKQGDKEQALIFYDRSLKVREEIGDKRGIAQCLNNIGHIYAKEGKAQEALKHFNRSYELYKEVGNKQGIGYSFNNMAGVYSSQGDNEKALEYYQNSYRVYEEAGDKSGIAQSLNNIAALLLKQSEVKSALELATRSLEIAKEGGYAEFSRNAYLTLARIDSAMNDHAGAFEHYKQYIFFRDSIANENTRKAGLKKQFQYEYEKKEAVMKSEQEKERVIAEEKSRKQKIVTWSAIGGLLLVGGFSAFIFRSLRITSRQKRIIEVKSKETEEQKKIIEEKNKDITDSINYAKRIQQAKLPRKEDIYSSLPHCFVLFKPKDIVSGDFYFFRRNSECIFLAAADCTGHGVPGAFMSMIGSERLDDAVSQSNDPSEILQLLNKGIKTSLRQSDSNESTRDGMDIALCTIDTKSRIVRFAGANRPFWLIRNGQVEEIKATKKAIGGLTEDNQRFDTHELRLQQGDTFYIFSDGYADLFSGENGKKLTTKKFREELLRIQHMPMREQESYLDNFAQAWSRGTEQVDDILVIGVKL